MAAHEGEVYDAEGRRIDAPRPRVRAVRFGTAASHGVGMGSALAIAISWSQHQSILWAIVHGFFGWFYVAWYAITR